MYVAESECSQCEGIAQPSPGLYLAMTKDRLGIVRDLGAYSRIFFESNFDSMYHPTMHGSASRLGFGAHFWENNG